MPHDLTSSDPIIIFIGPGRSGSTVISEIIMVHEDLAWPAHYLEYAPGFPPLDYLRRAFDNRFWRVYGEKEQLNRTRFLNTLVPRPAEAYLFWDRLTRPDIDFSRGFLLGERATHQEKNRIRRSISEMKRRQKRSRFAMKITGPGRIGYLKSIFRETRFVYISRDPVATVNSMLKVPFWKTLGMHRLWWTGAYSPDELAEYEELKTDPALGTAFQLRKIMTTTRAEARATEADILDIRFEDFVADPHSACDQILKFANLSWSPAIRDKLAQTKLHDRPSADILTPDQTAQIENMFAA